MCRLRLLQIYRTNFYKPPRVSRLAPRGRTSICNLLPTRISNLQIRPHCDKLKDQEKKSSLLISMWRRKDSFFYGQSGSSNSFSNVNIRREVFPWRETDGGEGKSVRPRKFQLAGHCIMYLGQPE